MMTKYSLKAVFLLMIGTLLLGCAAGQMQTTQPLFSPETLEADQYEPKVDNFMVILDKSSSMSLKYNGEKRLAVGKDFLTAMNQTIPDMKLNCALRTFGTSGFGEPTALIYGPTEYSKKGFQGVLDAMERANGRSPMGTAITAACGELKKSEGQIAVIIVSDGADMDTTPITAAKNMKSKFGDRLCIYTVLVGDDSVGETLMQQVADAGDCGFSVRAEEIKTGGDMGEFVKSVFLAEVIPPVVQPMDSDQDGVTDDLDRCPGTPIGVKVDARGCPLDSDGDGVYDYLDKCPGTPKDAKVNAQGCWILGGILFDTNKSDIKPDFYPELDAVVAVLEKNTALNIKIKGHTDNIGKAAYNMKLSESRAKAVMEYLVKKGIDPQRLSAKGYGLTLPMAGNDTPHGRAKNRRVELEPIQ
jgi:OmpA-OmpF porin, OOP family